MSEELFFEIPDDSGIMSKLVEAVPNSWAWVDGFLEAPPDLTEAGAAIKSTGFAMLRNHNIRPTIRGRYNDQKQRDEDPDLYAIIVDQKLPGFIHFVEAGYESRVITMALTKRVVAAYLRKGYRGGIDFFKDCYDNKKYENSAVCELNCGTWEDPPFSVTKSVYQPSYVRVSWEKRFGGSRKDIESIINICQSLNLQVYHPTI